MTSSIARVDDSLRHQRTLVRRHAKVVYLSPPQALPWVVMKYAIALAEGGADVKVFSTLEDADTYDLGIVKGNVAFRRFRRNFYVPLVWRFPRLARLRVPLPTPALFSALLRERADIYIAGQPDDLPIVATAARIVGGEIAYIPFEYYPGLSSGDQGTLALYRRLEKKYSARIRAWISLGDKLSEEYRRVYGLNETVHTIYSALPRHFQTPPVNLRQEIGASKDWVLVLYQGQVSKNRGLWDVLEALKQLPDFIHFVVLGGKDIELFRTDVDAAGLRHRVHIMPFVPQNVMMGYTLQADIGIICGHDVCLSYHYCNPGKLFEYIAAGLPVAVSDLPQLRWYVRTRKLGEVFTPGSAPEIARAIKKLAENKAYRAACARASRDVHQSEACWEVQAEKLRAAILR